MAVEDSTMRLQRLTDQNRSEQEHARERELIALRHQIALERLRDPGGLDPAPAANAPLHFEDGLPSVDGASLDAAITRQAISSHGSLLVRGLISAPDVERLLSTIESVFASFDAVVFDGAPYDDWFSPFPGREPEIDVMRGWLRTKGGVLTGDSPRATFEVSEVFVAAGIHRLAEQYLGQPPILSLDKWTLRKGSSENGIEWHQDGAFLGDDVRALNVWLALSDCGDDAPSLEVVPRRFDEIVPTGTDGASFSWSVGHDAARRAAGPAGWCRPLFRTGDALLFDDKLLHRTGSDEHMTQTRFAIETWFFAPAADTAYIEVPLML
jgi:Phytanoyl-CoA dioxygenase (PhyH)